MPKSIQSKAKSMIHKIYIRLRNNKTKGCGSRTAMLSIVFKLTMEAARTWKKLKGHQLIMLVLKNRKFVDGELVEEVAA